MSSRTTTIVDADGDVWTGKVESKSPDISDLLIGIVCPPFLAASLASSDKTTVVVNGERHTGNKVNSLTMRGALPYGSAPLVCRGRKIGCAPAEFDATTDQDGVDEGRYRPALILKEFSRPLWRQGH